MPTRAASLPTGTVTFLFTDIEGSTRLLQALGERFAEGLEDHAGIVRAALASNHGVEVGTGGDSFFAVFPSAADAMAAAAEASRALAGHEWPGGAEVRLRMGIHTGEGRLGGDNYVGLDVHRAARIAAAGHGGQVLISEATRALVATSLPDDLAIRDLGVHRLKDLDAPERLFQLDIRGLPAAFPPVRAARAGNLPTPATSFVGRDGPVAEVVGLLGAARLVTLVGPGGAGKTRLAIRVASDLAERFADGAWFVALESVAEARFVPATIGRAVELPPRSDMEPVEALRQHFATRHALLVVDNFEQVLDAAGVIDAIVSAAPRVRIIVTSRAPLGLYGEQQYPVPPLSLPDRDHLPDAAQLSQYEAVALFIARARAVRPGFSVTNESAPAVAEICARVDGLPLAIELAAARIKLLTPDAILRRLASSLDLLAGGSVNLTERQRTLRGAIRWSYDLLTEAERGLLDRISVFDDGWDLEAAEAVADLDGPAGIDLLDGLASLVDKSLVRQRDLRGEPRFDLLETIREFALEQLAERGIIGELEERRAGHFAALVEAAEPHLNWTDDASWYGRLTTEYGNVRGSLRWAVDAGRADIALRLCGPLWRFWQREGTLSEGRWWVEQAVALAGAAERTAIRAKALLARGSIAYWQGDMDVMRAAYEEALAIYREIGDLSGTAWATFDSGFIPVTSGDPSSALLVFRQANELFRELGDGYGIAESLFAIAYTELIAGHPDVARPGLEEALGLAGQTWVRRSDALIGLGQVHRMKGDRELARRTFLEALSIARRARDMGTAVGAVELLGAIEVEEGRPADGARLLGAGGALRESSGGGPPPDLMLLDEPVAAARRALGSERYAAEVATGRALDLDAVVELAERRPG